MEQETLLLSLPFSFEKEKRKKCYLKVITLGPHSRFLPLSFYVGPKELTFRNAFIMIQPVSPAAGQIKIVGETVDHEGVTRLLLENLQ